MKISEILMDKYKLRIAPTVYYELLADVVEAEEEQEPCDDTISRAEAIKQCGFGMTNLLIADCLRRLPSVTPKQRWIPVSERLPKNDEDVLVCYPQGGMEVVYYHIDNSIYPTEYKDLNETGWCNEEGDALYFEPIAWMPLPESYGAESEETE